MLKIENIDVFNGEVVTGRGMPREAGCCGWTGGNNL